jgi:hypothetical protein
MIVKRRSADPSFHEFNTVPRYTLPSREVANCCYFKRSDHMYTCSLGLKVEEPPIIFLLNASDKILSLKLRER